VKKQKNPKNQTGLSILEIIISLFLIGVVLILYSGSLNSVMLTSNAGDQELALRIANNKIESLRAGGYAAVPTSGSFSDSLLSSLPSGQATLTTSDYNSKTKQVDVLVSWTERGTSKSHNVSLTTLITQTGGLQ